MTRGTKTSDPLLVRLLDEEAAATERAERCYRRLKRAFTALEKVRVQLRRLAKRIERRREELAGAGTAATVATSNR